MTAFMKDEAGMAVLVGPVWRGVKVLAPLAVLFMGGCASLTDPAAPAGAAPVQQGSAGQAISSDAIASFAASAAAGEQAQVRLEDGREVMVVAGRSYTSALGQPCRRVSLHGGGIGSRVSAVCRSNGAWTTVLVP